MLLLLIETPSENLCMYIRYRYRYVNQYLHKDLYTPQAKMVFFDLLSQPAVLIGSGCPSYKNNGVFLRSATDIWAHHSIEAIL